MNALLWLLMMGLISFGGGFLLARQVMKPSFQDRSLDLKMIAACVLFILLIGGFIVIASALHYMSTTL